MWNLRRRSFGPVLAKHTEENSVNSFEGALSHRDAPTLNPNGPLLLLGDCMLHAVADLATA